MVHFLIASYFMAEPELVGVFASKELAEQYSDKHAKTEHPRHGRLPLFHIESHKVIR